MQRVGRHGSRSIDWMERTALFGSFACMVHCLALPLLAAALPALSSVLAVSEAFHLWMLALAIPTAAIALVNGRARHRVIRPLRLGSAGLVLLALGGLAFEGLAETIATVAGSVALARAHIANWRLRRTCLD